MSNFLKKILSIFIIGIILRMFIYNLDFIFIIPSIFLFERICEYQTIPLNNNPIETNLNTSFEKKGIKKIFPDMQKSEARKLSCTTIQREPDFRKIFLNFVMQNKNKYSITSEDLHSINHYANKASKKFTYAHKFWDGLNEDLQKDFVKY